MALRFRTREERLQEEEDERRRLREEEELRQREALAKRRAFEQQQQERNKSAVPKEPEVAPDLGIAESAQEVEMMRRERLGQIELSKRRILKPERALKDGMKWDNTDDTARNDVNPLYLERIEIAPQTKQVDMFAPRKKHRASAAADGAPRKGPDGRHWSEKPREEMTARDWRIFREDHGMSWKGGRVPPPARTWGETGLPAEILAQVERVGYVKPSPIQMAAIPVALQGRDLIGIAETGSGKTAAFVLPLLVTVQQRPPLTPQTVADGPYALVMAPTRELVLQIGEEARKLGRAIGLKVVCVVGGESIEEQGMLLREGCHLVVATPGRMKDCLERRFVVLQQCDYVVLDEADRMIDMGFEDDVKHIISCMKGATILDPEQNRGGADDEGDDIDIQALSRPMMANPTRTTILYSATMPPAVERVARTYMQHPVTIIIGAQGKAVDRIEQRVVWVPPAGKNTRLLQDLKQTGAPIIVFCNQRNQCDVVLKLLQGHNVAATVLHAGKSQEQRESNLNAFRAGKFDVLVATNVAGRGIDIPGVAHVINYDCPLNIEDYTHRIGRTGRAGTEGLATTYIYGDDSAIFYDLKRFLQSSPRASIPADLRSHPASNVKPGSLTDKHASFLRWLSAPTTLWKTRAEQQPRTVVPAGGTVLGNYPPPAIQRNQYVPSNIGWSDDRWLDWLAILALFGGLMYAVWLGATPQGKYSP